MSFGQIVSLALGAILIENFIFSQFLGICPFMGVSKKVDTALGMGVAVIFVMTVASIFCYIVNEFLLVPLNLEFMQTVAYILVIASLVQFVEMFLQKMIPSLYQALGIYLPLITTNCAVLGAVILNMQKYSEMAKGEGLLFSVLFGFFAAVGFTLAIVIFAGVRARIEYSEPPKSFKGMPIALIAAGLIAMAFSGFSGTTLG